MSIDATAGTKRAIRRWAKLSDTHPLSLDDKLDDLRPSQLRYILRTRLNQEFDGEKCFPIPKSSWDKLKDKQKLVRDVRDEVARRQKSGEPCGD